MGDGEGFNIAATFLLSMNTIIICDKIADLFLRSLETSASADGNIRNIKTFIAVTVLFLKRYGYEKNITLPFCGIIHHNLQKDRQW